MAAQPMPGGVRVKSTMVEKHFPTTVMLREFDNVVELNRKLSELLLRLEKEARNVAAETSTVGGFQTDNNLLMRNEPEIVTLRGMIQGALQDYLVKLFENEARMMPPKVPMELWGWGINMREGDINTQHVHPNAKASGCYYISMPPATQKPRNPLKPDGAFIFTDPRPRANMNRVPGQATDITIPPKPGQMLLFPSYYEHFVLPFRGQGVRQCIAFNLQIGGTES